MPTQTGVSECDAMAKEIGNPYVRVRAHHDRVAVLAEQKILQFVREVVDDGLFSHFSSFRPSGRQYTYRNSRHLAETNADDAPESLGVRDGLVAQREAGLRVEVEEDKTKNA